MRFSFLLAILACASIAQGQDFQSFLTNIRSLPESGRNAAADSFMKTVPSFPLIEYDTIVNFIYRGAGNHVTVAGDANFWNGSSSPMTQISGTDFWYLARSFESDARLDYKFVVDDTSWILDPRNPNRCVGGFGPNSELRMPKYRSAPEIELDVSIPHGTLHDTTLYSPELKNTRKVRVYLPPGYDSSTAHFPMILFHDGLEYVSLAQVDNVFDNLIAHHRIAPVIAVFVPPVDRTPEYAREEMAEFASFIVNSVLPFVESHYRIINNPSSRATLGASFGGNIALYLGYNYPKVFGNIGAQSSYVMPELMEGFRTSGKLDLKLYLDLGTYDQADLMPLVREFVPILQAKGYPIIFHEYHEGHSWGNWRAHVANALEFFFPPTK